MDFSKLLIVLAFLCELAAAFAWPANTKVAIVPLGLALYFLALIVR